MLHICAETHLSPSPKAPPANVSLTRTGWVVDLDIGDHREGTSIHFHDPAPLVIIVHKRPGGDTDLEVKYVIAIGICDRHHPAIHYHEMAATLAVHHKDSTPANIEDLAALLYEMRENQDEHYRKTDERLATLKEIMMFLCIRPFRVFLLAAAQLQPGGHRPC
jgi:hypothetical protein